MTDSPGLPSEEEIARVVCRRVHEALHPDAEVWRPGELDIRVDQYWPHYVPEAQRILSLIRPAFEREIADLAAFVKREQESCIHWCGEAARFNEQRLAAEANLAEKVREIERLQEFIKDHAPLRGADRLSLDARIASQRSANRMLLLRSEDYKRALSSAEAKLAQAVEAKVEIRRNDDGTIDEVVASGSSVHLEQLDKGSWYLGIYSAAGDAWQFWLSTDKPGRTGITINHEHSPARSAAASIRGETR